MQCFRTGWRATKRWATLLSSIYQGILHPSTDVVIHASRALRSKKEKDDVTEKARENPSSLRIPVTRSHFSQFTRFFWSCKLCFLRINLLNKRDNFRVRFYIKISFLILSLRIYHELKLNMIDLNLKIRFNVTQPN